MSRMPPGGRPTAARSPGEAFGLTPVSGPGPQRQPPADLQEVLLLRAWSLRLGLAAQALQQLALVVGPSCDDAGLVGPAGDALRRLGDDVSRDASSAARAAQAAADALDQRAASTSVTGTAGVVRVGTEGGRP